MTIDVRAALGLIFATVTWGQPAFQNLAPNGDGSVVFFSSPLRMKGTDQFPSQPKIFAWDQKHGVKLYRQKPPTIDGYLVDGWTSRTAYNLVAASISSDGGTIAITGLSDCTFGSPCAREIAGYEGEIERNGGARLVIQGFPTVSPNGCFVALGSTFRFPLPFESAELTLLDLSTGQQQQIVNTIGFPLHHAIANDGTAIVEDPTLPAPQLRRWNGTTLPLNASAIATPLIDSSAKRVFYQILDTTALSPIDLMAWDLNSGAVTKLASVDLEPGDPPYGPVPADISDDGSLTAFVRFGQAWIVRADGTAMLQVTNIADKIVEIALSGSGSHLFAITDHSRLLRINLSTMAAEEIIPATPIATGLYLKAGILSPGGLAEAVSTLPIPELQSVSLFGHDLAIVSATPASLQLQAPYDLPDGTGWPDAVLKRQSEGPFESAMLWFAPVEVASDAPAWHSTGNYVAALHQDFSAQITAGNPAHPGEIVHGYGSGFGMVAPSPPFGKPASASPLSRTTTPLVCGLEGDDAKLVLGNILFSGLAPGFVALYQFDIQLPARPAGVDTYLVCGGPKDIPAGNYAGGLLPMAEK